MRSAKRARSVAHSLAHHATGGLCYVHPHLGAQCRKHQKRQATIDLLRPEKSDVPGVWPKPLELSLTALGRTFTELLIKERIDLERLVLPDQNDIYELCLELFDA